MPAPPELVPHSTWPPPAGSEFPSPSTATEQASDAADIITEHHRQLTRGRPHPARPPPPWRRRQTATSATVEHLRWLHQLIFTAELPHQRHRTATTPILFLASDQHHYRQLLSDTAAITDEPPSRPVATSGDPIPPQSTTSRLYRRLPAPCSNTRASPRVRPSMTATAAAAAGRTAAITREGGGENRESGEGESEEERTGEGLQEFSRDGVRWQGRKGKRGGGLVQLNRLNRFKIGLALHSKSGQFKPKSAYIRARIEPGLGPIQRKTTPALKI